MTIHVVRAKSLLAQLLLEAAPEVKREFYKLMLDGKDLNNYSATLYVEQGTNEPKLYAIMAANIVVREVAKIVAINVKNGETITVSGENATIFASAIRKHLIARSIQPNIQIMRSNTATTIEFKTS